MATAFTARRNVAKFSDNPDSLGGQLPRFPAGVSRSVTTSDGAVINTVTAGPSSSTGSALVVLVHGLTSNMDDWGPIAHRLVADGIGVLGVDQRGHGGSTTGSEGYGAKRLGADLAEVFETLDLRNVVLAGHSMGGMAALSFLVDHPGVAVDRVRGLALLATAATMSDLRYQAGLRLGSLPLPIDLSEGSGTSATRLITQLGAAAAFGHEPSSFMLDAAIASFLRCPEHVRLGATRALADHDVTPGLSGIKVPTLIAVGTRDLLTPFGESEQIANAIPGARLLRMPGVGHQIIWERNEELAKLLADMAQS